MSGNVASASMTVLLPGADPVLDVTLRLLSQYFTGQAYRLAHVSGTDWQFAWPVGIAENAYC